MLKWISHLLVRQAEKRIGVDFDYTHKIADTSFGLLMRYTKIFNFMDPNKHTPKLAYHAARLRGAISADCGTCVETEIKLAQIAKIDNADIDLILTEKYDQLSDGVAAAAKLADAVTGPRQDDPEARRVILEVYDEAGLIELSYAMTGAAVVPGIKRAMGYAQSCNIDTMRKLTGGIAS
ncbi:MAG: hypothetical protein JJ879_11725 [Sneathiella sp.]|nr:hypothetical protein [Sneathiella sp.]